ncbi:hypothetical protein M409DRAFT_26132 [Zasmidium cellare ATCC 36951]|uniref:Uncharacterized protein n=1 Tax=Zasmidium cellare ATCC 36951 TaxID=1080233 RepID=A0A6A6C911_ZASCE|nr:uncharacterized protein M409DRAFT_26132 [Zasmidium cellare ATCC 36951]KAF2163521.1 hypothetical protein M409DRAFT_26132 [Zasmidium cellare ATCC 36951]
MSSLLDSIHIQDVSDLAPETKVTEPELYVLLGHFQPLKPPGHLRRLGRKLLKHGSPPKHEYDNVHYSRLEGLFSTKVDAERRMQALMVERQVTFAYIAPHPVLDPSAQEVGMGLQFETSSGLQSYWIIGPNPKKYVGTLPFGIMLEQRNGDQQGEEHTSDGCGESYEDSKLGESHGDGSKSEESEEDCAHESLDQGLLDGRRIDRDGEKIKENLRKMIL